MQRYRPRHGGSQRAWRGAAIAAVVVVVAALTAAGLVVAGRSGHSSPPSAHQVDHPGGPATASVPAAVEVSSINGENSKPGTRDWLIAPAPGAASIEGYADHTSAQSGQTVSLYVSTAAASFHVTAYRMGYYGGSGGRLVWTSSELAGKKQSSCPVTSATNTVECSWTSSVSVPIDKAWPPGAYLFKLSADPGQQSYIPLTVWDPSSHATYVIQSSVLTWQAWNDYGGYSNFGGIARSGVSPSYADRARVLSYDRPYAKGSGAGDFLGLELPLISLAEEQGLDVTYWTDIDFSEHPQLIANHKALLSLGHNEFITREEREGEVEALGKGVNLAFFGATPNLRPARLQASPLGADREEVAYRDPVQDPLTKIDAKASTANTWAQPPLNKPASRIVGNTYGGFGINASLVVTTPTAWPFVGTGLGAGSQLQHVILGDYDNYVPGKDSPANVEILAHSPVRTSYGHQGMADMTYYTDPVSNAGVFATGSIGWIPSLSPCPATVAAKDCPAAPVATITDNVLRLFGAGPAGATQPSVANWQKFRSF